MATPLLRGLPDEIVVREILLACLPGPYSAAGRAISHAWRRATSTRRFLRAHHASQPNLPLLYDRNLTDNGRGVSLGIIAFESGLAPDQLHGVARHDFRDPVQSHIVASSDGLIVLFINDTRWSICNPATHQYAPLPLHGEFVALGMYLHHPTGEYRLLLNLDQVEMYDELPPGAEYGCHVFTVGSVQPPRHIGIYEEKFLSKAVYLMFRGRLHWYLGDMIMVFDTIAELFAQMGSPVIPGKADLFEIGGMLGIFSLNDEATVVDIWVMHDYESELWAFKRRVELPVAEIRAQPGRFDYPCAKAVSWDGGVVILVKFGDWLHRVDINGKLVASFHRRDIGLTNLWLKQTLVSHTFYPTLEGYVVNAFPFI